MKKHKKNAFTLIEIIVGVLIVSMVMIGAFQALTSLGFGKVRLMQKTVTQKQMLYFSEKLFEMIKYGGTIDFEEYFNRKVADNTSYSSGHYATPTGFGNFGYGGTPSTPTYGGNYYYCLSGNGDSMGDQGCVESHNTNDVTGTLPSVINYSGEPQRYGQYSFQFKDYNSNEDNDGGDQNRNDSIIGDDDDDFFGRGPNVFGTGAQVGELYLINGVKRQRTLFRYNVKIDPYAPPSATCTTSDSGKTFSGDACLGTIEYLVLDGVDWGLDHNQGNGDATENDGVIDTWLINEKFSGNTTTIADSDNNNYWQALFPETISVSEFTILPHPNIDQNRAWDINDPEINISEYVRITVSMNSAWKHRRQIKGTPREYTFSTTINLTDIFSR